MDYQRLFLRIKELKSRRNSGSYNNLAKNQKYLHDVIKNVSGGSSTIEFTNSAIEEECGPHFDFRNRDNLITDFCYNKVNMEDNENKFLVSPARGKFRFVGFDWKSPRRVEIKWDIRVLKARYTVGWYRNGLFNWDFSELEECLSDDAKDSRNEIAKKPRDEVSHEINVLWNCKDEKEWKGALKRYWKYVKRSNRELERKMNRIDINTVMSFDQRQWYAFLLEEYFPWKFTDSRWLKQNMRHLEYYDTKNEKHELFQIKEEILSFDKSDIQKGLSIVRRIKGLGTAGASGLLSILFPRYFGTVDRFAVEALSRVDGIAEANLLGEMRVRSEKSGLDISDAVVLIEIMRRKAKELNDAFDTDEWTPRRIDMVLWGTRTTTPRPVASTIMAHGQDERRHRAKVERLEREIAEPQDELGALRDELSRLREN